MPSLLMAHLVMGIVAPLLTRWLGRRAFLVLALAPASVAVYALSHTAAVMRGHHPTVVTEWIPGLGIDLAFRVDTLTWLMLLLVGSVGALVLVYCSAYFSSSAQGLWRFSGVLTAFAGAMAGLVAADDVLVMFVFWELTTVFSYLLIGHYADRKASRRAAMQAIMVTTAGGLAMLAGLIVIGESAGTYRLSEILAAPPAGTGVTVAVVCVLLGAVTKSALLPFHFWLPAAMAAPTPVSAYLHAAAMVKAGVYLVARFAPAFSDLAAWQVVVVVLGAGTLLLGGYRALRQHDLKLVLAFGTVSQLGLIILLVGIGTRSAALAGMAMIGAHAMFKAALFLVTGVVDAATGTRDLRRLTGVGREMPLVGVAGGLAVASMIGVPPLAGYVAKEAALESLLHDGAGAAPGWVSVAVVVAVVVGSMLTFAYGLRFFWGAFCSKAPAAPVPARTDRATGARIEPPDLTQVPREEIHHQSPLLWGPPLVLAVLGLAAALVPHVGEHMLSPHADLYASGEDGHLTLWGGLGPALWSTVAIIAVGTLLFVRRRAVERLQARVPHVAEADRVYRRFMRGLDDVAADVTALTQRGSLPFYLGGILVALVVLPGGAMLAHLLGTGMPAVRLWDSPAQLGVGVVLVVAAVLATRARRRLKAVMLVGVTGYGTAVLFLLQGAPDLALTQVLVETISLVVFVLVLRRLPAYYSNRPLAGSRWVRLSIGVAVGLAVAGIALTVPGARTAEPVSTGFPAEVYAYGGGKNIVNVVLVDTRAWDTMGEISVLLVAATGVASLVFLRRRSGEILRAPATLAPPAKAPDGDVLRERLGVLPTAPLRGQSSETIRSRASRSRVWLTAQRTLAPQRRSVIFEVATRLLFHAMIVFALFLLFSGHNAPGGGFAAGLITGIAIIVRYLAGGRYELGEAAPVHPGLVLGTGLFLSVGVGLLPVLFGGVPLQSAILHADLPLVGDVKLVTSLFFDIGVYLVVIGLVLDIVRSLGAEIDRQTDHDAREAEAAVAATLNEGTSQPAGPVVDAGLGGAAPAGARGASGDAGAAGDGQGGAR